MNRQEEELLIRHFCWQIFICFGVANGPEPLLARRKWRVPVSTIPSHTYSISSCVSIISILAFLAVVTVVTFVAVVTAVDSVTQLPSLNNFFCRQLHQCSSRDSTRKTVY